jgi:DNA (cytosine-5)-methyltransferase 1
MHETTTLKIGSLCTGYGGLDIAVIKVFGARLAWCGDNDRHVSKILALRYPGVPNLGDLTQIDWSQLEPLDILCAGFPCQDISSSGKRLGIEKGEKSGIWRNIIEGIRILRPKLIIVENVSAIRSRGLDRVLGDLAESGYDSVWTSLRASEVGAAHRRERVFILGYVPEAKDSLLAAHTGRQRWPRWTVGREAKGWWTPGGSQRLGAVACSRTARQVEHHPPTDSPGQQRNQGLTKTAKQQRESESALGHDRTGQKASSVSEVAWGQYEEAIRRWEAITGRCAPYPVEAGTKGQPRLSPAFSEWLMGLPRGFVTDLGLPYSAQHRAIGNGVMPRQAVAALWELVEMTVEQNSAAWAERGAVAGRSEEERPVEIAA